MNEYESAQRDLIHSLERQVANLTALAEIRKELLDLRSEKIRRYAGALYALAESSEIARKALSDE